MEHFQKRHPELNTKVDPGQPNREPSKSNFLESPTGFIFNSKKNLRLNKRVKSYSILKK